MDDIDPQPQPFNHLAARAKDVEEAEAIVAEKAEATVAEAAEITEVEVAEITEVEEEEANVTMDDIDTQPQPFNHQKAEAEDLAENG